MSKLYTWIRRKLGIKDVIIVLQTRGELTEDDKTKIQKEIADELPDHYKVVLLPPFCTLTRL